MSTIASLEYLRENMPHNIDMIEVILRGRSAILHIECEGVVLREETSGAYMMTAENELSFNALVRYIDSPGIIATHESFYIDKLIKRYNLRLEMTCRQAVWPKNKKPPEITGVENIQLLTEEHLEEVNKNYSVKVGKKYLEGRIAAGELYGAFIDNTLVGFIGLHEEGSIGILEVLKDYRRQGVAQDLIAHMINVQHAQGHIPYGQFSVENTASMALLEKTGFILSGEDELIYWLSNAKSTGAFYGD